MVSPPERSEALAQRLSDSGLRSTPQREVIYSVLLNRRDHPTAEEVFARAKPEMPMISLATVYNTLHQFTAAGILREIAVDGARVYFDTNTSDHHHFLLEDDGELYDIPGSTMAGLNLPKPPEGLKVARIDVVVRLRREASA